MMFITKKVKPNSILENACRKFVYAGFMYRALLRLKTPDTRFVSLVLRLLSFCFLASPLSAQTPSLQSSPADILISYLERASQDTNSPTVQTQNVRTGPTELLIPFLEKVLQEESLASIPIHYGDSGLTTQEEPKADDSKTAIPVVDVNQESSRILSALPAGIDNPLGRQLWKAGIGFYERKEDKSGKSELKRLIEQIRAFEPQETENSSESVSINVIGTIEPKAADAEPNITQSGVIPTEKISENTIESGTPFVPVTDQTLRMLGDYAQDANGVPMMFIGNPLDLAEILYLSGYLEKAAPFYRQALVQIDKEQEGAEQNKAWILFQLGNCLRKYDLPAAKKTYVQLITEYPQSEWADLARVWEKIIDLYLKDNPEKLIEEP